MALPNGVRLGAGRRQFITQRGYFAPPYVSCMFASLCMLLEWAGYRVPVPRNRASTPPGNFVWRLHKASGASLRGGSDISHTKTALRKLLPDAPMQYGSLTNKEFIRALRNDAAIRVTANCRDLKATPGCVGNVAHAYAVIGVVGTGAAIRVFVLDPMGRPGSYSGAWMSWPKLRSAVDRTRNGEIIVTLTYKDAANG